MEYCNGGDLRQVLNKPANCCGIPEKDVLDILRDISSAVVYLHSVKVVHRDIKPENVVIQQTEEKVRLNSGIDNFFPGFLPFRLSLFLLIEILQTD
jgi:serine/threonine protein kinase